VDPGINIGFKALQQAQGPTCKTDKTLGKIKKIKFARIFGHLNCLCKALFLHALKCKKTTTGNISIPDKLMSGC
jgi:hypothetical protein